MPLAKQIAEKKAQENTPRVNPEIDAKINRFIQENPDLYGYYQELSKEQLVRMWIASGEPPQIARQFERSVLDIKRRGLTPNKEGYFDDDGF